MSSFMKYALPALALTGSVYAQSSCSTSATATIQNAGDATALAACKTFSGSIAIATGTTDDIALNGIKKLDGDLIASDNANMKRISADSLEEIDGTMTLDGLTRLYAVEFPKLKKVQGIKWNALPNLQTIGFTAEVTEADKITSRTPPSAPSRASTSRRWTPSSLPTTVISTKSTCSLVMSLTR